MIPPQQLVIVIGFREEPLPKGHGYLFWRLNSEKMEHVVCYCDLFEVLPDVVGPMFCKALNQIMSSCGLHQHQISGLEMHYENMSSLAVDLLAKELGRVEVDVSRKTLPYAVPGQISGRIT